MVEGGQEAVRGDDAVVSAAEVRELKKRIRQLERVLGKKTSYDRNLCMTSVERVAYS